MSAAGVGWPIPSSDAFALSMRYLTERGLFFSLRSCSLCGKVANFVS